MVYLIKSNQIKSNQIKLRMDASKKRILQFEGNSFVKESKKLPEVRKKMIKTSTAQAKETKKNKTTNKTKKKKREQSHICPVQEHY